MRKTAGICMLAALLLMIACGCADHVGKLNAGEPALREAVDHYHELLQMRDFDAASLMVKREYRNDFNGWARQMQRGYTLDSYAVVKVEMNPAASQAAVVVSRSFIAPGTVTLQTKDFVMHWELQSGGSWVIASPPY